MRFRTGLLILAVAVSLPYAPILAGYVFFPADIVVHFPPWEGTLHSACCDGLQHSELGDLATQIYPWRILNSALHMGQAPLWDFYVNMGVPYQAMPMSGLFFPLNWVFSVLSVPFAWSVLFIIRAAIMAISTAIFVRRLGASQLAALLSGFIFAMCGWVMAFQGRPQLDSAMWLPLMFLAVDSLRAKPSLRSVALAAVAFALPVLAGHPEVAFEVIFAAVPYAVYRLFPLKPMPARYLAGFAVAGILSVLLAAVQLLPTLEWMGLIPRSLELQWGSQPSSQSIAFLSRDLLHHPNTDKVFIPEAAAYIGAFTAAVLPFVVLWRKRSDVLFFAVLAFFCIEISYGWQPGYWLSLHIPVLSGLPNWRLLVVADFVFAVLAGLAITAVESRCAALKDRFPPATPALWFLAGAAAGALVVVRIAGHTAIPVRWNLALVLLSLAIVVLASARRIHARDFILAAVVVVSADLLTAGFEVIPFVRPGDIFPSAPVFDFLRARAIPMWRVCALDVVYGVQFDLPYGLSSPAGYDFPNKRVSKVLSTFKADSTLSSTGLTSENILAAPKGTLDLTGTRYFVTTDWNRSTPRFAALPDRFKQVFSVRHVQVYENPDAVPLVSFLPASSIQVIENEDDQLKGITSAVFDGKRTVIVPQTIGQFWGPRGAPATRSIANVTQSSDQVSLLTAAEEDGLVYFNESYYPGWIAEVDGVKAPVVRANYAFMAVPVSRGYHTVRFRFIPAPVRWGGALSGVTALVLAGVFAMPLALRRRART